MSELRICSYGLGSHQQGYRQLKADSASIAHFSSVFSMRGWTIQLASPPAPGSIGPWLGCWCCLWTSLVIYHVLTSFTPSLMSILTFAPHVSRTNVCGTSLGRFFACFLLSAVSATKSLKAPLWQSQFWPRHPLLPLPWFLVVYERSLDAFVWHFSLPTVYHHSL